MGYYSDLCVTDVEFDDLSESDKERQGGEPDVSRQDVGRSSQLQVPSAWHRATDPRRPKSHAQRM